MESFFSRFKNPLVLIAVVLVQVIALAMQLPTRRDVTSGRSDGPKTTVLRRWTSAFVTPVERVSHGTSLRVRSFWSHYVFLRQADAENKNLKLEVARLRQEQAALSEDAAQGRRLQALLKFQQQYISSTVAAQVIGTSGSDRSQLLTLDKGSADGLKAEQAVITPDGIVGKLRDVAPHSARVLLISDASSGAGVVLESTRIRAILRGTATGQVQIGNLTADSRIQIGERVLTSGGDQVFPRGIPVGVIQSIAPDPTHQPYTAIGVKPYANLERLEEVLVVTGMQSALPVGAQQDLAVAQALAQENQRAADLIAEKLPSLHDTGPPTKPGDPGSDQVGGVPGVPNSGLPKPRAVLHTDKFSPGATPSAEELKPGAPTTVIAKPPVVPQRPAATPEEEPK